MISQVVSRLNKDQNIKSIDHFLIYVVDESRGKEMNILAIQSRVEEGQSL